MWILSGVQLSVFMCFERHPPLQRIWLFNAFAIGGTKIHSSNVNTSILFGRTSLSSFFCNMENSLKGQMVEPLCTRTVKFVQVEMMLWVAKLQLAWCLQGPRGFSTTTAPDGIVHHQSAARAVPTGLVSYPLRKLHTRKKKSWKHSSALTWGRSAFKEPHVASFQGRLEDWKVGFCGFLALAKTLSCYCDLRGSHDDVEWKVAGWPSISLLLNRSDWNARVSDVNRGVRIFTHLCWLSHSLLWLNNSLHHSQHSYAACENQ